MEINLGPIGMRFGKLPMQRKAGLGTLQSIRGIGSVFGEGPEYAPAQYANYYAQSVPAYRAIKLRADAVAGAPLLVYRRLSGESPQQVEEKHPVQVLLNKVNGWWTAADLWRATETYLSIWGSAFWYIEKQGTRPIGIWPLRPDKMRIVPDLSAGSNKYITGYIYEDVKRLDLLPEEIVWFRYFNPLNEYAGQSPIAAGRLSLDM